MTGERERSPADRGRQGAGGRLVAGVGVPVPVVVLACTTCQHVYTPDRADFAGGRTGCPLCGGWTWIAQLGTTDWSQPVTPTTSVNAYADPAVTPLRTSAGSASPTTST